VALHGDLQRSGAAYSYFLELAADGDKVTSRAAPFFDAVASGDRVLSQAIASHASRQQKPDRELPDDFLYVRLLMDRFFGRATDAETVSALGAFEAALEGTGTPRFEVCQALVSGDPSAFHDGFMSLVDAHRAWYTTGLQEGRIAEEDWAIDGCIFIEGLALLRLAVMAGIPLEEEYPLVPSVALRPSTLPSDPHVWRLP
jgi:hypothetical protein